MHIVLVGTLPSTLKQVGLCRCHICVPASTSDTLDVYMYIVVIRYSA